MSPAWLMGWTNDRDDYATAPINMDPGSIINSKEELFLIDTFRRATVAQRHRLMSYIIALAEGKEET